MRRIREDLHNMTWLSPVLRRCRDECWLPVSRQVRDVFIVFFIWTRVRAFYYVASKNVPSRTRDFHSTFTLTFWKKMRIEINSVRNFYF